MFTLCFSRLLGAGKSTNFTFLTQQPQQAGVSVQLPRELGGTPLAESIRELLLTPRQEPVSQACELMMMFAARAQHIDPVIESALARGDWVICDRITDATYAYQGGGRGIDQQKIADLEPWVRSDMRPVIALLLDVPIEVGMARAKARGKLDRLEQEQQFFQRIRDAYLMQARHHPERYRLIDAACPLAQVRSAITAIIAQRAVGRQGVADE